MSKSSLPARARKSRIVYLRVTPPEFARMERATKRAGKHTLSEWLREVILSATERGR
jgi:hypothetical protein